MKRLSWRLAAISVVAFPLISCASHHVPFNEAEFTPYARTGTGVVDGQAFRISLDNSKWVMTHRALVELIPANAYTDEIAQRKYANRVWLTRPDPHMAKYVRRTYTDENGNFVFRNVPPGNYYVANHAEWTHTEDGSDPDGNPTQVEVGEDQWLWNRTWVKNGERTTVTGWEQGK